MGSAGPAWRRWSARLAAASLFLAVAGSARAEDPRGYTLAVVPNLPALTLHKAWSPFVERLSTETGIRIDLKLYERLGTFLEESVQGKPDFIYSAPNMFWEAYRAEGYVPLFRGSRPLSGVVFVRKDSPYRTVQDLRGKRVAFVGPKNLCAVITRHALAKSGTPIEYSATFSGSTINVATMVALRKAEAGATLDASLISDAPELAKELRIILQTDPIAPHVVAAHPRVSPLVRERVTAAALALAATEDGRALLAAAKLASPVRAELERDYGLFETIRESARADAPR